MKSMFCEEDVSRLKERVQRLTPEHSPRWGRMRAGKAVCHLADSVEYALSEPDPSVEVMKGPPMVVRHVFRLWLPWPKGAPTVDEMMQTEPGDFDTDRNRLLRKMDCMLKKRRDTWPVHPFFGPLDGLAWARLTWRHIDHHLKQFGL